MKLTAQHIVDAFNKTGLTPAKYNTVPVPNPKDPDAPLCCCAIGALYAAASHGSNYDEAIAAGTARDAWLKAAREYVKNAFDLRHFAEIERGFDSGYIAPDATPATRAAAEAHKALNPIVV